MATLSRADVEHVAHLARLGLSDEELARLEGQLNHIVDQYAILARLDTETIPPTAQTIEGPKGRLHRRPGDHRRR
jgi:aspartyl-tRNA(Asn)/glutamyl-tRNA(Gln) amidotransferase subunit C